MQQQISIVTVDYGDSEHARAVCELMDEYARDPMGGAQSINPQILSKLPLALANRSDAVGVLAYLNNQAVGLINAFEGFSTFACKPLLNIHDVIVRPSARRQGVAKAMLQQIEWIARQRGYCKLTLEVLSGNSNAQNLYRQYGFNAYQLDDSSGEAIFWQKPL